MSWGMCGIDVDVRSECRVMEETGHCKAHMHVVDCFLVLCCTFVYFEAYLVLVVYSELIICFVNEYLHSVITLFVGVKVYEL